MPRARASLVARQVEHRLSLRDHRADLVEPQRREGREPARRADAPNETLDALFLRLDQRLPERPAVFRPVPLAGLGLQPHHRRRMGIEIDLRMRVRKRAAGGIQVVHVVGAVLHTRIEAMHCTDEPHCRGEVVGDEARDEVPQREPVPGRNTTLLMSTGLTFGTISSLFGLSHGLIDQAQYSALVAAVVASAVVPTVIANAFFMPHHVLHEHRARQAPAAAAPAGEASEPN